MTNNQNLIKEKLNQKNICIRTEGYPEAQYFGLREGLSEISWDDDASNVLVLIGDCGNHKPDPKGATLNDVVDILPLINNHHAYLNKASVQEYLIDIFSPEDKKTLKMTIRSDSGVRPEKGTSGQGRLGQYLQLKMQYSGAV